MLMKDMQPGQFAQITKCLSEHARPDTYRDCVVLRTPHDTWIVVADTDPLKVPGDHYDLLAAQYYEVERVCSYQELAVDRKALQDEHYLDQKELQLLHDSVEQLEHRLEGLEK